MQGIMLKQAFFERPIKICTVLTQKEVEVFGYTLQSWHISKIYHTDTVKKIHISNWNLKKFLQKSLKYSN